MNALDFLTLGITAFGSAAVLFLSPLRALTVFFWVMLLYPQSWNVDLPGLPTLFPAKVMVFPLAFGLFIRQPVDRPFRIVPLDIAVVLFIVCKYLALMSQVSIFQATADVSHDAALQLMTYFSLRLALHSRGDMYAFLRMLAVGAIPLVAMAFFEAATGTFVYNLIHRAVTGSGWDILALTVREVEPRLGVYRPLTSFGVHISLGLFFAAMIPLTLTRWNDPKVRPLRMFVTAGLLVAGVVITVSSAPLFAMVVAAAILACYPLRWSMPLAAPLVVLAGMFFQFMGPQWGLTDPASDQLRNLAYSPKNAEYRIGLVREAFGGGMDGHWLFGYGYNIGIGKANPNPEFRWKHDDIVNIHIAQLARSGLFGLLTFELIVLLAYFSLAMAAKRAVLPGDSWTVWCFFAFYTAWHVAFMTVSSIYQINILLYTFTGIIASLPLILAQEEPMPETEVAPDSAAGAQVENAV